MPAQWSRCLRARPAAGSQPTTPATADDAKAIARAVIESFERFDYVVAPSGSCAGMLKLHYPALLADDPAFAERARALGDKSFELTSFLVEVLGADSVTARLRRQRHLSRFLLVPARAESA